MLYALKLQCSKNEHVSMEVHSSYIFDILSDIDKSNYGASEKRGLE